MVVRRRRKVARQRGNTWHGWGRGAAHHKGSGNRGGKGMAGSGKRADQKKPSIWKEKYFGKFGFKKKGQKEDIVPINIKILEQKLVSFEKEGNASKSGDVYTIDLEKAGYNKLLGDGKATKKMKISVKYASHGSIEKVKEAGGEVIVKSSSSEE